MEKPFVLLLKISGKPDSSMSDKIGKISATPFRPLMFGDKAMAIGVTWDGTAHQLWNAIAKQRIVGIEEMTIVQAGNDWCGMRDKAASGWLVKHLGDPKAWASNDD